MFSLINCQIRAEPMRQIFFFCKGKTHKCSHTQARTHTPPTRGEVKIGRKVSGSGACWEGFIIAADPPLLPAEAEIDSSSQSEI